MIFRWRRSALLRGKPIAVAGALLAAVVLAACGSSSSGSSSTATNAGSNAADVSSGSSGSGKGVTLHFSWQTADFPALFKKSGLFNNTPYTLDYSVIAGPAAQIAALDGGHTDIGEAGDNSGAFQIANSPTTPTASNIPVQGIAVTWFPDAPLGYPGPTLYATKSSGINSLAGLKGHTVGYNQGGNIQAGYVAAVAKAGLSASDVKPVVFQSNPEAANAFDAGHLDAVVSQYANVYPEVSSGKAVRVATRQQLDQIGGDGWLATTSALKDPTKLAAIKDFFSRVKTFFDQWYPNHESDAIQIYETVLDQSPAVAKINYEINEHTKFYSVKSAKFLQIEQTGVDNAFKDKLLKTDRKINIGYNPIIDPIVAGSGS
jgi:sulfonate transport system substrate-binding protein